MAQPHILLVQLDFSNWAQAKAWSYLGNFAIEDGLKACGCTCFTLPAFSGIPDTSPLSWLYHAKQLVAGQRFDQVWIWLVHQRYSEPFLDWVASLAPVRVGLIMESLRYSEEDCQRWPHLQERESAVGRQMRHMTHVLAVDERDAERINETGCVRAMFWPSAVPARFICPRIEAPAHQEAAFYGELYGDRKAWIDDPLLTGLLVRPPSAEAATDFPRLFDALHHRINERFKMGWHPEQPALDEYVGLWRRLRQAIFGNWLATLKTWSAIVNLPSLLQSYPGRVVEAMAAGRPVVSWAIPDRPKTGSLFRDGREILLYSRANPAELAKCLQDLRRDPAHAADIATAAREELLRSHTAEQRATEILRWIQSGAMPWYELKIRPNSFNEPSPSRVRIEAAVGAPTASTDRFARGRPMLGNRAAQEVDLPLLRRSNDYEFTGAPSRSAVTHREPTEDWAPHPDTHQANQSIHAAAIETTSTSVVRSSQCEDTMESDRFYVNLFVHQPEWSTPQPNADESARWTKIAAFLEHILRRTSTQTPTEKLRILDVGCGRGWLTNLATMYGDCEGIEPVAGVVEHARKLFPHLRFEACTAADVKRRPDFAPYDVILTSEVIEHVPHPEKDRFLTDIAALLKPEGYLILTTPRAEVWEQWKSIAPPNQPIEDWITEEHMRTLLTRHGFSELGLERIHIELPRLRHHPAATPADIRTLTLLPIYQVWVCQKSDSVRALPFTKPPKVSVIVPTYNRPARLKAALASIAAQTFQDYEVIVVNDAGCDVSGVIAESPDRSRITYICHDRNRGLAATRNTGLRQAKGAYIAYLDDDDRFLPDHIETLVTFLETHKERAAYTDAWRVHEERRGDRYVETKRDVPYSYEFDAARLLIANCFPVLTVMHERACLEDAGLFDESLTSHEDWDLWIRIAHQCPFRHIKKITAEFTWRTDGSSMTSGHRSDFYRTAAIIYEKYRTASEAIPGVRELQARALQELRVEAQAEPAYTCSIIMPVWNKVELTRQCLVALASATTDVSFELIVVDNASTDSTPDLLASLAGDVRIIRNDQNLGFAKACNQGARAARGKYLVFLNNDTIPQPHWLTPLVREVEEHPEVGVVGSKLLFADGTIQHAGVVFTRSHLIPYHAYRTAPADLPAVNQRREFQAVTGACMLIRRNLFEAAGGFDEAFENGFEDVDLCLKVRAKGYRIVYQPRSALYHLESQTPTRHDRDDHNGRLLRERWGSHWWLADEDLHYHTDGFKLVAGPGDRTFATHLRPLTDVHDRASWAHVAAAQAAASKQDWGAVRRELSLVQDWPDDRFVLAWGATVCQHLKEARLERAFRTRRLAHEDSMEERLALARSFLSEQDLVAADIHIQKALAVAPEHPEGWLLQGILSMQREQYIEAERAFSSALRHGADRRKCLMGLGMASLGRSYPQGAWERFVQVLAEHPDDAEAIHWLLRAGTAQNRWVDLSHQLHNYLSRNPGDLATRFALAGVLLRADQLEQARREYDALRTLAPTYDGLIELGRALAGKEAVVAVDSAPS